MTGVVSADPLGLLVAFGAGIISFLSPCVLPLVPGYLSMVSGMSAAELESTGYLKTDSNNLMPTLAVSDVSSVAHSPEISLALLDRATPPSTPPSTPALTSPTPPSTPSRDQPSSSSPVSLRPLLRGIVLFIIGFTIVFVALGAVASGIGHLLSTHKQLLSSIAGTLIVVMGVLMLLGAAPAKLWQLIGKSPFSRVAMVIQERRFGVRPSALGVWAAPIMGVAFAFAWTPCIGPVLGTVLGLAANTSTLGGGVLLLFAYSLGLGIPFLITGLAFARLTTFYSKARQQFWIVHVISGLVLVAFGILLLDGQLSWISIHIQDLMRHIGLGWLTTS